MDKFTAELITSESALKLSSDSLRVYLILRADVALNTTHTARAYKKTGELVSGLDVQSIAEQAKVPPETAQRLLNDLIKRGWLKRKKLSKTDSAYQLGVCPDAEVQWFVNGVVVDPDGEPSVADTIREAAKEASLRRRSRPTLSEDTKRKVGREILGNIETGIDSGKRDRRSLMDHFKTRYKDQYDETPEIFSSGPWGNPSAQANSYMKRFYGWCGDDVAKALILIDFLFDEWPAIYEAIGGSGDKPSLNILGSKALVGRLQIFKSDGIPVPKKKETTAKRHDSKASEKDPDVGW